MDTENTIMRYFADLEDPRIERNRKHPLMTIITIAILGVICGADTWVDIERYGRAKMAWLGEFLDIRNGIPSHDTFGRVFRWLDGEAFQQQFMEWTRQIWKATQGEVIALDGKKLRRSHDRTHGRDGLWVVSAWVSENRLVLGQQRVENKSNEISAIPELLAALDITGCVVTIDAMGTQTAIAQQIIDAQADYILPIKNNQGTLHEDVEMLFDGFEENDYEQVTYDTHKQTTEAHDRREIRQCWVVNDPEYCAYLRRNDQWAGLKSLVKLATIRITPTKTEISYRYFISSWTASAADFLGHIRDHWQIENGLHWVLDIAFREDESRIRKDHAPQNMATLRHMAINLLKQERSTSVGISAKRKMAGWDNTYLCRVIQL